jgi:anti-sigma-K factor RskA
MMPHVDLDRLTQLALDEPGQNQRDAVGVAAHLDSCADCRAELDALRDTVRRIRSSIVRPADVTAPPERVWRAITAELAESRAGPRVDHGTPAPAPEPAVLADRAASRRRRWVLAAVAVIAALAGIAGTLAVTRVLDGDTHQTLREVPLAPLTDGPQDVSGQAAVAVVGDVTAVEVSTSGLGDPGSGFYEVWVINPDDLSQMYSIGALGPDAAGRFSLPSTVDLDRYSVVDISIEPDDGDPTHSTHSVLRGVLPKA